MAYKDFSKRKVEKRIIKIDDQIIDVSRIPTRVMLKLAELKDREEELKTSGIETFMELVKIISLACGKNKKITPDWLIDHTDIEMLTDILEHIIEPLTKIAEKAEKRADKRAGEKSKKIIYSSGEARRLEKIINTVILMYGFSEEFILDERTLEEVLLYYDDGIEFEFLKADILIAKVAEAITGKKIIKEKRLIHIGDKPDLKKFRQRYGKKIVRPKR